MKHLLLLVLPLVLVGCPGKEQAGDAAPAPEATAAPTATTEPAEAAATTTAAKIEFMDVGMVQATGNLPKFHWRLTSATDAKGQPIDALQVPQGQPVTLDFRDGKLAVSNTCNRMGGGYKLGKGKVTIDKLASTKMACTDPRLMALDQEVGKRLQGELGLRLSRGEDRHLELKTAAGDVLVFAGARTTASLYRNQQAERVFLEVAAQTKPCSHPLIPNMQCLQVRELKYNDKGLKVGTPGEFKNFYDAIEGYTHEPGVRNVLRVNRYSVTTPPADTPTKAYVLDMVVESDGATKK